MSALANSAVKPAMAGVIPPFRDEIPDRAQAFKELLMTYSHIPKDKVDRHLFEVRAKAWALYPYPCVGAFSFTMLSVSDMAIYQELLTRLKRKGSDQNFLDMACCFAQDIRKLAADGVPTERMYGSDLQSGFLELGYELFRDKDSNKATFVAGDIFNHEDLTVLIGKMNIIHAANFLHLFTWEQQVKAAVRMVEFLKPDSKDTIIFGRQLGSVVPGNYAFRSRSMGHSFWHDEKTFEKLWNEVGKLTSTKWKLTSSFIEYKRPWIKEDGQKANARLLIFELRRI